MRRLRKMMMAASLAALMMLMMASPIFAASDVWFSQVKFDQNGLTFKLESEQCLDAASRTVIVIDEFDQVIESLEALEYDDCQGYENGTYNYTSVIDVTYEPVRLNWNGMLSPPIFNGMDFSESELIFYLEDYDGSLEFIDAKLAVSHPIFGHRYEYWWDGIRVFEQAPYIVIDRLDDILQDISSEYFGGYPSILPEEFEVKLMIESGDTLTVITPQTGNPGRIIPLRAQSSTQFEIVLPAEKEGIWNLTNTIIVLKDENNRVIGNSEFPYSWSFNIVNFPAAYNYDIIAEGYAVVGGEREDFFLMQQDVQLQPGGITTVSFYMDDLMVVEPELDWVVDLSEYGLFENDLVLNEFSLIYPNEYYSVSTNDLKKLYVTNEIPSGIVWSYHLRKPNLNYNYNYLTEVPHNGKVIKMSNELITDLRLEQSYLPLESASDDIDIPLFYSLVDGYGNWVSVIRDEFTPYDGKLIFQKVGTDQHIEGTSEIDWGSYAKFPNNWVSEEPLEPEQLEGLYKIVHEMEPMPVTMKQTQYLYYISEETHESIVDESGLSRIGSTDTIDLQKIVQSMRDEANGHFWETDEALKSFHIRFLMEMIDSKVLQFPFY